MTRTMRVMITMMRTAIKTHWFDSVVLADWSTWDCIGFLLLSFCFLLPLWTSLPLVSLWNFFKSCVQVWLSLWVQWKLRLKQDTGNEKCQRICRLWQFVQINYFLRCQKWVYFTWLGSRTNIERHYYNPEMRLHHTSELNLVWREAAI